MTLPKSLQWYHSKADLIWPDDPFNNVFKEIKF